MDKLEKRVTEELDIVDSEPSYREMLDECYSFESVGGIFAGMSPSRVLEEMDPTAYRCGLSDYEDSRSKDGDIEEVAGDWYDAKEVEAIREEIENEEAEEAVAP